MVGEMEGRGLACVTAMSIDITVVEVFTRSAIQQQLASQHKRRRQLIHWPSKIRVSNRLRTRTHCLVRICPSSSSAQIRALV